LFNYYYKFVEYYIVITRALIKLKIEGFKGSLNKGRLKRNYTKKITLSKYILFKTYLNLYYI